jgi:zinc transport system substrate-binding protein
MPRIVLVLILSASVVASCGGSDSDSAESGRQEVVAAFYPLAWAAEQVGGDSVHVRNLTPPGTEPHDIELSPRDVTEIRSADVVLYLDRGFQPAVEDAVRGADGKTLDLLSGQDLFEPAEQEGELTRDPHIWLDPVRYQTVVRRIAEALGRPEAAGPLVSRLAALNQEYSHGLKSCRRREIVTTHAAFGYLADRYHLEQIPITGLSPEAEPTPRDLEGVVDQVRKAKATTIFFETLISPRLAETVARETGSRTDVLDPIEGISSEDLDRGADYLSVMRTNLAALRRALACR